MLDLVPVPVMWDHSFRPLQPGIERVTDIPVVQIGFIAEHRLTAVCDQRRSTRLAFHAILFDTLEHAEVLVV